MMVCEHFLFPRVCSIEFPESGKFSMRSEQKKSSVVSKCQDIQRYHIQVFPLQSAGDESKFSHQVVSECVKAVEPKGQEKVGQIYFMNR